MILAGGHRISALNGVIVVTLMAVLAGLILPKAMIEAYIVLFGVLLILAGVPHGASDFLLFRELSKIEGKKNQTFQFFLFYGLLMVVYSLTWWLLPLLALCIFLIVSAYHFGQSNWSRVKFSSEIESFLVNLLWGAAIIGVPVMLHWEQASMIIQEMTGYAFLLESSIRTAIVFLLVFGNLGALLYLNQNSVIEKQDTLRELRNFFCLMLLFFCTPLLIGFGVYFVFWHSLISIMDQIDVVRSVDKKFGLQKYLKAIIPLSLMAFAGLALLYYFFGDRFDVGQNLGALFLFVSVITVPHSLLMEWLYRIGEPVLKSD